jgi:hypothetical protein
VQSVAPFPRRVAATFILIGALSACTPTQHGLYDWGDYEDGMSAQLLDNDPNQALAIYERTLTEIQQRNGRVPPGLFADYGFLLYLRGNYEGAEANFGREKQLFPEAAPLMDKLIARVRQRQGLAGPAADGVPAPTPPYSSPDSKAPLP